MRLTLQRSVGRYINPETKRPVNVYKAHRMGHGVTVIFYMFRRKRQFITDSVFSTWERAKDQ